MSEACEKNQWGLLGCEKLRVANIYGNKRYWNEGEVSTEFARSIY
jgi:hypothetical protein